MTKFLAILVVFRAVIRVVIVQWVKLHLETCFALPLMSFWQRRKQCLQALTCSGFSFYSEADVLPHFLWVPDQEGVGMWLSPLWLELIRVTGPRDDFEEGGFDTAVWKSQNLLQPVTWQHAFAQPTLALCGVTGNPTGPCCLLNWCFSSL